MFRTLSPVSHAADDGCGFYRDVGVTPGRTWSHAMSIAGTNLGSGAIPGTAGAIGLMPAPAVATIEKSVWASMPLGERLEWVARFRQLVAFHQPRLCELICEETKKPAHEALLTDVAPLLAACKWMESNAARLLRDRELSDAPFWMSGTRMIERRVPVGKVGIIATWNYPVQLLGIQLVHALAAGNTVVVKPSERTPRTQTRLLEIAMEAGLPMNTLTWVGATREAGQNMLSTQRFDHVIFTGSTETGQKVAQQLAKTFTPGTLELSGRDSVFVLEDANVKQAAKAVWAAVNVNAGQTCMGPRRVLVLDKAYDKFCEHLAKFAATAKAVDLIDEKSATLCKELTSRAIAKGAWDAAMVHGDKAQPRHVEGDGTVADEMISRRFRPTALLHCQAGMDVVEGRHFGPLVAIVRCVNLEDALNIHRRCDQHLTASVFTRDVRSGQLLADRLGATNVMINDIIMPSCHPAAAIGGRGPSGVGFSRGEEGLLGLTRPMYVSVGKAGIAKMIKPLPAWQLNFLSKFLRWWYGAGKVPGMMAARAQAASEVNGVPVLLAPDRELPLVDEPNGGKPIVHSNQAFSAKAG